MSKLTLARAKELLAKYTSEEHLFHHAAAVSAAMGAMAEAYYKEIPESIVREAQARLPKDIREALESVPTPAE